MLQTAQVGSAEEHDEKVEALIVESNRLKVDVSQSSLCVRKAY